MSFTPEPYDPPSILNILKNSYRVQGTNEVVINTDNLSEENESVQYLIGVATGPAVLVIIFFIWVFALCCVGCCRRRCSCGNTVASILFTGFMLLSCFGWFYSIGGNGRATGGVEKLLDQTDALFGLVQETVDDIDVALAFVTGLSTQVTTTGTDCNPILSVAGLTFPTVNLTEFTDLIDNEFTTIKDQISGVEGDVKEVVDDIEPYLTRWEFAYKILVSCIIVLTAIFTLATLWRIVPNVPGQESCLAKTLSKSSGTFFLTIGVLLLFLIWIVVFILALISTVGADLCMPSPTDNLLNLVDQAVRDNTTVPICDEEPYNFICYFSDCVGTNPLLDQFDLTSVINDDLEAEILDVLDLVNSTVNNGTLNSLPGFPSQLAIDTCVNGINDIVADTLNVDNIIEDVIDVVECSKINPIYTGTVNQGLCEGVVAGLGVMWVTMALGALSLMAAMLVYRIFEFNKYEYGEYVDDYRTAPQAQVVGHADYKA